MSAYGMLGRTLLAATTVFGAVLTSVTGAAVADPTGTPGPANAAPQAKQSGYLNLMVKPDNNARASRGTLLTCNPNGGTHPNVDAACKGLAAAHGDFNQLTAKQANTMCPMMYKPVTITADGMWQNTPVKFEKSFPNACVASSRTGEVFKF